MFYIPNYKAIKKCTTPICILYSHHHSDYIFNPHCLQEIICRGLQNGQQNHLTTVIFLFYKINYAVTCILSGLSFNFGMTKKSRTIIYSRVNSDLGEISYNHYEKHSFCFSFMQKIH